MRLVTIQGLIGALAVSGCSGPGRASTSVTRDSSGISIVENAAPADGAVPRYTVDSVPGVEIRSAGGSELEFSPGIIPTRLSDGRIVVADPLGSVVHLFSTDGQKLKSFGRKGQGPGEFERIASIARYSGDSLVAYDVMLRRYSVFDDTGGFVRNGNFTAGSAIPIPVGAFRDGALLIQDGFPLRPSGVTGAAAITGGQTGEQRAPTPLFRAPINGSAVDSIGAVSGAVILIQTVDRGMSMTPVPFGPIPVVSARDSVVVSADGDEFDFAIRHEDGQLVGRFRRPTPSLPVTSADVEALVDAQLAELPGAAREMMEPRLRAALIDRRNPRTIIWSLVSLARSGFASS